MKSYGEIEIRLNALTWELARMEKMLKENENRLALNFRKFSIERESLITQRNFIKASIITLKWVLAEGNLTGEEITALVREV